MPECSYLTVSTQMQYDQLLMSRLRHQKRRLKNSIILWVSIPKVDMTRFDDEIDANATRILNKTEHKKDDEESSYNEILNPENPELHHPQKSKRSANTSDLPSNKKPVQTRNHYLESMSPLTELQRMQQLLQLNSKSQQSQIRFQEKWWQVLLVLLKH